jgi:hypothetical protein
MNHHSYSVEDMTHHRVSYDSHGWYCLDCSWPDDNFTWFMDDAAAHESASERIEMTPPRRPGFCRRLQQALTVMRG